MTTPETALVSVRGLEFRYPVPGIAPWKRPAPLIVKSVSFDIFRGETLALVGESGSGKTTIARCLVGLYRPTGGTITYRFPASPSGVSAPRPRRSNPRVQIVFQDPYASLDPRWRVGTIIAEPIRAYGLAQDRAEEQARIERLLQLVGLHPSDKAKYPHQFSGGQRQRISIARALAGKPDFIVCDEPTSALDVSIQARILNLLKDLQQELGLTYLLITHNLGTAYQMANRIAVLDGGEICEIGQPEELFNAPRHDYTRKLIGAVPRIPALLPAMQPKAGQQSHSHSKAFPYDL